MDLQKIKRLEAERILEIKEEYSNVIIVDKKNILLAWCEDDGIVDFFENGEYKKSLGNIQDIVKTSYFTNLLLR